MGKENVTVSGQGDRTIPAPLRSEELLPTDGVPPAHNLLREESRSLIGSDHWPLSNPFSYPLEPPSRIL